MKLTGLAEQYDGGRDVFVQQEGPHVMLSVDAQDGAKQGTTLLTPAQARTIANALTEVSKRADEVVMEGTP